MSDVVPLRPRTAEPEPRATERAPLWREAVGREMRRERQEREERIADVADRAGISPQYLSELERGCKDPSSEVMEAVAGALGLRTVDLARRAAGRLERAVPSLLPSIAPSLSPSGGTAAPIARRGIPHGSTPTCLAA